jgi:hypothetical protein
MRTEASTMLGLNRQLARLRFVQTMGASVGHNAAGKCLFNLLLMMPGHARGRLARSAARVRA